MDVWKNQTADSKKATAAVLRLNLSQELIGESRRSSAKKIGCAKNMQSLAEVQGTLQSSSALPILRLFSGCVNTASRDDLRQKQGHSSIGVQSDQTTQCGTSAASLIRAGLAVLRQSDKTFTQAWNGNLLAAPFGVVTRRPAKDATSRNPTRRICRFTFTTLFPSPTRSYAPILQIWCCSAKHVTTSSIQGEI